MVVLSAPTTNGEGDQFSEDGDDECGKGAGDGHASPPDVHNDNSDIDFTHFFIPGMAADCGCGMA
jgi:hypothetical protein